VSRIAFWLSDALCRLATGGGFSTRKLYTDDEEQLFNAQRPSILNGIEDFVDRPDLADRTVFLTLEPIPEDKRKADQALQDEFNRARPQILGALLNLMVVGLQRLPRTRLDRLPRMADFALWGTACEREPAAFIRAYEANRRELAEGVLDADAIASAIRKLMAARKEWKGTASQLLGALEEIAGDRAVKSKGWPGSAEALGRGLRRPATFLRKVGIEIERVRDPHTKERTRLIKITRQPLPDRDGKEPSEPSDRPEEKKTNGLVRTVVRTVGNRPTNCPKNRPKKTSMKSMRRTVRTVRTAIPVPNLPMTLWMMACPTSCAGRRRRASAVAARRVSSCPAGKTALPGSSIFPAGRMSGPRDRCASPRSVPRATAWTTSNDRRSDPQVQTRAWSTPGRARAPARRQPADGP